MTMYFIFRFRDMQGHVTKNTVSVQGFLPEIYTILIFYLKALSTKNVYNNQNILILSRKER